MKKIVLVVTAMMAVTICNAETENTNRVVNNVEDYNMSIDMRRLAVTLGLTQDQMETVKDIHNNFSDEMLEAGRQTGPEREAMVDKAVRKDVHSMHYVLTDKQFRTYMRLLGTTLRNKGLK